VSTAAPLVSVIVPSYNQGRFLRASLESIFAQDYRPLEVLVLDGGSKDESVAVLEEFARQHPELRWWSERDRGVADAVNKGFARARGEIAAIQSSDDVYLPGAIRAAVAQFESNPDAGVVFANMNVIDEQGAPLPPRYNRGPFTVERFLSRALVIHQSSAFFRLGLVRELGGWDERYFCCDSQLWLRLAFRTRFVCVEAVWSAWRRHGEQRDKQAAKMREAWSRMIRDSDDLRGAPARLRRAARAGCHVLAIDYGADRPPGFRGLNAWLALLAWPRAIEGIHPKTLLLPGVGRVLALFQR
jgi:glycosyltransferase involved in cell wall biosynthesis